MPRSWAQSKLPSGAQTGTAPACSWTSSRSEQKNLTGNSTNVFPHVRAGLIARARYWQRPTVAVLFDVPLATVEQQNARRSRVVARHVVRELHQMLPDPEQLRAEGFGAVHLAAEIPAAPRSEPSTLNPSATAPPPHRPRPPP